MALPLIPIMIGAGFGADMIFRFIKEWRQGTLSNKQLALGIKQMAAQSSMGRMEQKRIDEMISRLMAQKREERAEGRAERAHEAVMASKDRQAGMMMAMFQALNESNMNRASNVGGTNATTLMSMARR